jgi:hypothetical protein
MRGLFKVLPFAASLSSISVIAPSVQADENQYWDGDYGQKAERRSDVVLGASTGLVLGSAIAYPNEVEKIDDPDYEVSTGLGVGSNFAFWLGGALKDWFVFGVGGFGTNMTGSDVKASGGGAFFHVETYPFYPLGGHLRDLAIYADFGAGSLTLDNPDRDRDDGEAGFVSVLGAGAAYELFRVGHFAFAPNASYSHQWSQTGRADFTQFGLRAVFYGGPG